MRDVQKMPKYFKLFEPDDHKNSAAALNVKRK